MLVDNITVPRPTECQIEQHEVKARVAGHPVLLREFDGELYESAGQQTYPVYIMAVVLLQLP